MFSSAAILIAAAAAARGLWSPCGLSMVSAINPLAERARGNRYWLTAIWFILGSLAGGLVLGGASGIGAMLVRALGVRADAALAVGAAGCLVAVAADLRLAGFHLPLHPRQVNERWLGSYRRWIYAAGFGVQIGVGFATYIMTAATYLLVLLAALTGSPAGALIAGLSYGVLRGLAVLLSARCRTPQALLALHRRLSELGPPSERFVMLAEAGIGLWLAYQVSGPVLIIMGAVLIAMVIAPRTARTVGA
jgi:hypothetical protein